MWTLLYFLCSSFILTPYSGSGWLCNVMHSLSLRWSSWHSCTAEVIWSLREPLILQWWTISSHFHFLGCSSYLRNILLPLSKTIIRSACIMHPIGLNLWAPWNQLSHWHSIAPKGFGYISPLFLVIRGHHDVTKCAFVKPLRGNVSLFSKNECTVFNTDSVNKTRVKVILLMEGNKKNLIVKKISVPTEHCLRNTIYTLKKIIDATFPFFRSWSKRS